MTLDLSTPETTEALGRAIGRLLFPGSVLALVGPLGAGKTLFTKAIAEGLDIAQPELVTSPTFVLIQEYPARLPIYHFDVYRLKRGSDFIDLGAMEYMSGQGVCLIEWADKVEPLLPTEHLRVELDVTGTTSRRVKLIPHGQVYEEFVARVMGVSR